MNENWFDLPHVVQADEVDAQQHVHNLRYLQWSLWAARDHNATAGWDAASALSEGFGWVVRDHEITYRVAAVADQEIVVRTWVSEISRYSSTRKTLVCRPADQKVLARISTRWVYVDLKRHRALEIPAEAKAGLAIQDSTPPLPWELSSE
ncbi:acyl-CoA thioesterase [Neorhodopirellula lusitana]|uniref:acyl-CoA thioesterase n=1 Tax=Neorhodopirellula lusitana TaxID=445327 RepID=UPI00384A83A9